MVVTSAKKMPVLYAPHTVKRQVPTLSYSTAVRERAAFRTDPE